MMPQFTEEIRKRIAEVRQYAESHPATPEEFLKNADDPRWANTVRIEPGFVAVYTMQKVGRAYLRHLSVRLQLGKSVFHPSDEAFAAIMHEFGYNQPSESYIRGEGPSAKHVMEAVPVS